ncbi:SURF1 family protein [Aquisediminimonas profunda]|uniref:SURF1 family protein n=1 Tax=Aquisediminimonas profunda TaxID=1550733 RepID=UPI001C62E692|nr:SURF1 family protein [Aquisediminimonas profunda]
MNRIPVLPTLLVCAAIAVMIRLGLWQLQRADEKAALLVRYEQAETLPEMAFPQFAADDSLVFRRAGGVCLEPQKPIIEGGLNAKGEAGWRHIVACRTGTEGPGMTVDIGWSSRFDEIVAWKGGQVHGIISRQPDHRSLIEKAFRKGAAPGLMLVLTNPGKGLDQSAPPSIKDVPNNHLAYAVQWFVFAAVAAVIYGLALYRRRRS